MTLQARTMAKEVLNMPTQRDLERGTRVTKGQLIGWMGDSGNAETITSHLAL
jgi:murein DD-endopeptidase MepM/ murein hydrolase activator NlpD